jgi:protein-S-isoprenylcysteine O-methyltransferase Ste14
MLSPADAVAYVVFAGLFAAALLSGVGGPLWYASLALSAACAVLWLVARWQLGASFSVGAQAKRLVTGGLYARVRHPIYVFGTLAFLFTLLALQGWPALIAWVVVGAVQVRRAAREERVLAGAFGAEYAAYRSKTWF